MTLLSRVTIAGVAVDGYATLSIATQVQRAGGSFNLRMADGSIKRQVAWEKDRVTLTCVGWIPPALAAVDWSQAVTIVVPDLIGGTRQWTGYADPPQQTLTAAEAKNCQWVLTLEET